MRPAAWSALNRHRAWMMLVEVPFDDPHVLGVGLEKKVKKVARKGNCAEGRVDGQIARHPPELPFGQTEIICFPNYVRTHSSSNKVADNGHQPNDGIETHRSIDTGNYKTAFKQHFQHFYPAPDLDRVTRVDVERRGDLVEVRAAHGHGGGIPSIGASTGARPPYVGHSAGGNKRSTLCCPRLLD